MLSVRYPEIPGGCGGEVGRIFFRSQSAGRGRGSLNARGTTKEQRRVPIATSQGGRAERGLHRDASDLLGDHRDAVELRSTIKRRREHESPDTLGVQRSRQLSRRSTASGTSPREAEVRFDTSRCGSIDVGHFEEALLIQLPHSQSHAVP